MHTLNFVLEYQVAFGEAVYFVSNIQDWKPERAIRMTCVKENQWCCRLKLFENELEYKYFVSSYNTIDQIKWEDGPNRLLKLTYMPRRIKDRWGCRRVIFVVFGSVDHILIEGNCEYLDAPSKMKQYKYGNRRFFYKLIFLTLAEVENDVQVECYLIYQNPVLFKHGTAKFRYTLENIHQLDIQQLHHS